MAVAGGRVDPLATAPTPLLFWVVKNFLAYVLQCSSCCVQYFPFWEHPLLSAINTAPITGAFSHSEGTAQIIANHYVVYPGKL
jgi:hypothetical protein